MVSYPSDVLEYDMIDFIMDRLSMLSDFQITAFCIIGIAALWLAFTGREHVCPRCQATDDGTGVCKACGYRYER